MKSKKFVLLFFCISVLLNSFCQTGTDTIPQNESGSRKPMTKEEKMLEGEKVKLLQAPADKALVFIIRPTIMGFAIPMRLDCDSFQVGWISAKTFLYTILDPGMHTFKSLSENQFYLDIYLIAGRTYYIEQEVLNGLFYARTKLREVNEDYGKRKLGKCSISGSNRYPEFPLSREVEKSPPKE